MTRLLSALVALTLLAAPAAAGAAPTPQANAPAGNSAIDEYLETVPSVTGSNGPRPPRSGGGSATGALTTAQRRRLEQAGPAGRQLASVVDATAPATAAPAPARAGTNPRTRAKPHGRALPTPAAQGRSPVAEVLNAATGQGGGGDGGGMGMLLPAILLGSLLGVVALVAIRRRSVS
jgi:hypothetical protein